MPSLLEIAQRTGSDKLGHGYIQEYEKWFPKECRTFLEIGVERGKSAEMWDQYYGHDEIELSLVDLFINPEFVSKRWCTNRGYTAYKGDQSDISFLYSIKDSFAIVVEDASHRSDYMFITFKHIFFNNCRSGSIYAIEDTHTCLDKFFWGEVKRFEDTPLAMFKSFKETGVIDNPFFDEHEARLFEGIIDKVEILADEKLILIWRK